MAQGQIAKLPKLGEIKLPVHLMSYDDKENPVKHFQSNFAFFGVADGISAVSDNDGNEIGMIGGKQGGHVEMSRYYPHNGKNYESGKYKQWTGVIIDVRDMWDQIEALLESKDVKVQIEGMEEIHKKYQALMAKEAKKQKKLDEIKEMQIEAEAERILKVKEDKELAEKEAKAKIEREKVLEPEIILKPGDKGYEGSKWDLAERFGTVHGTYRIKDTEVYEDGNWDLTENLSGRDYEFQKYIEDHKEGPCPNRDSKGKIPINIGCNCLFENIKFDKHEMLYTDAKNKNPEVVLNITSYIGTSPGAIHYYGKLKFNLPPIHPQGNPNASTTHYDLGLFGYGDIELSRILEPWEFKKYPETYKGYRQGNFYTGFYTEGDIIKRGKEIFEELFSKDWKLTIDRF